MKKIYSRITAAILCTLCLLLLCSCDNPPSFSTLVLENPNRVVENFIEAIKTGDYEKADGYVANYSTLGFEALSDLNTNSADWKLYDALFSSYKAEFYYDSAETITIPYTAEGLVVNGKQAVITFKFTSLNFEKMSEDLKNAITELGAERMYYGETYETEEDAMQLVDDAYELAFGDDLSDYYTERELTINAWLTDDGWKLEISEDFYSALIGR